MPKRDRKARRDARRLEHENMLLKADIERQRRNIVLLTTQLDAANRANIRLSQHDPRSRWGRDVDKHIVSMTVSEEMLRELVREPDYMIRMLGERMWMEFKRAYYQRERLPEIAL